MGIFFTFAKDKNLKGWFYYFLIWAQEKFS